MFQIIKNNKKSEINDGNEFALNVCYVSFFVQIHLAISATSARLCGLILKLFGKGANFGPKS